MVMDTESDRISLSALCRDICDCMGIDAPSAAEPSGGRLKSLAGDRKCERVVMYNPDAQAEWLVKKYPEIFEPVTSRCHLAYKFATVMPLRDAVHGRHAGGSRDTEVREACA